MSHRNAFLSSQEYKPPASQDIPEKFNIKLYNKGDNAEGILGSKATGEPSVLLGVSVMIAMRRAINAVKEELQQNPNVWYNFGKWMSVRT